MKDLIVRLGIFDEPEEQKQDFYDVDLLKSHIGVFGISMSGKTTFLQTLIVRIHQVLSNITAEEEIYILDFSNNLNAYKSLPYITAYFDSFQEENVRRMFKILDECYQRNIKALPGKIYSEYETNLNEVFNETSPKHVTLIIDGLDAFLSNDSYNTYHEIFKKILRDGLSKGISIVFTASSTSFGIANIISYTKTIIALELADDMYSTLFSKKVKPPIKNKGRCISSGENGIQEVQIFCPYDFSNKELTTDIFIENLNKWLKEKNHDNIIEYCIGKKLKVFESELDKNSWKKYTDQDWAEYHKETIKDESCIFTAGLDYYSFEPVTIDLLNSRSIAIYGKKSSGKTNLLSLILECAKEIPNVHFVFVEDSRKGLTRNAESVKNIIDSLSDDSYHMIDSGRKWWEKFIEFLIKYGYITQESLEIKGRAFEEENIESEIKKLYNPYEFTVFVMQNRSFYDTRNNDTYIEQLADFVSTDYDNVRKIFIFSDVQKIVVKHVSTIFNNYIDHAFLLNDILHFVNDAGQNSVFGSLEQDYLKEQYGKCDRGDGFYLNAGLVEDSKIKIIKQDI